MKIKIILLLLAAVIAAAALAACGELANLADLANLGAGSGADSDSDSGEAFAYGDGKDYIADKLKGDYSITYRAYMSNDSDEFIEMTMIRTADGFYYGAYGTEVLYIKNDGVYYTYFLMDGAFTKIDFIDPMTEEQVQAVMGGVLGFMSEYGKVSGLKRDGSETVAGRDCERYKYGAAALSTALGFIYCIDKETGVCLKYVIDVAAGGESASMTFECTEFKTSGVTLPAYN